MSELNNSNRGVSKREILRAVGATSIGLTLVGPVEGNEIANDERSNLNVVITNNSDVERTFAVTVSHNGQKKKEKQVRIPGFSQPEEQSPEDVIRRVTIPVTGDNNLHEVEVVTKGRKATTEVFVPANGLGLDSEVSAFLRPDGELKVKTMIE